MSSETKRPKVLHLVPALEQGGVETVVLSLNEAVVGAGWDSVVVSAGGRLVARIEAAGGRHVALDVKSKNPLTYPIRVWRLCRLIGRERPDLVCVHSRVPAWLYVGVRALWKSAPPWLTYAHGANSVSRYSAVMTRGSLTVTPSRFLADYLKANYALAEEKIRIIHPAVDERRFDPSRLAPAVVVAKRRAWGLAADDFVVMAVGRITPLKGYDTLIRAVAELKAKLPRAKLVLVGDADARHRAHLDELKALARALGLGSAVVFAGGETEIPECLSLASVVVSSNAKKPESFGLSMAEALVMGKPVVAKAFGGALEIVRDGKDGVLTDGANFADALLKVAGMRFANLRDEAVARFGRDALRERTVALYGSFML